MKKTITVVLFSFILISVGFILGKHISDKKSKISKNLDTEIIVQDNNSLSDLDMNYIKNKVSNELKEEQLELDEEEMELNNELAEVRLKYENNPDKLNLRLEKLQKKQRELNFEKAELNFFNDNISLLEQIEEKRTAIHIEKTSSNPDNTQINILINERNKLEKELKEKKNNFEKTYFNN